LETAKTTNLKATLERILDIEKLKYCFDCGICTASCSMAELLGKDYNPRRLLERIVLNPDSVLSSEELWLCAWCYRCYKRCPQALKVPEIFLLMRTISVERGNVQASEKALKKIVEKIPLPFITILVGFHPERAGLDMKKVIEKMEELLREDSKRRKKKKTTGASREKVAVIGSGPAGLTVASELSHEGFHVTVFELLPELGGMLRKCIPEYRLPRQILDKEIQLIKDLGVEIRTGVSVGKDLGFEDLWKDGFRAVFIGTGAHKSQKLKVEGAELKSVIHALDFLWSVHSDGKVEVGKNVVVIGGGNVAVDAARTALNLGAKDVTILYRRSREEMPANPWEVKEGEEAGVKIEFLVAPAKILGEGAVSAIECVRTQLGEPDDTGRRKAIPIEGSAFKRETDMVILAIGEAPDLEFLPKETELNEDGSLWVNPITMETSMQGIFAGGDAVTGPASVIEAICAGKHAAESIVSYLRSRGG